MLKLLVASLACASASKLGASKASARPALDKTLKLRGGITLEQASLAGAAYYGGFGVTLFANPDFFYVPTACSPTRSPSPAPSAASACAPSAA